MDSKNWLLLLLVIGVVGYFGYSVSQKPVLDEAVINIEESDSQVAGDMYEVPADWEEYKGETINFYHPSEWEPEEREPFNGAVIEDVVLNIPDATDNSLYYSEVPYDMIKPDDIATEDSLDINNRRWVKWVREGENYVSYDYYTNEVPNKDVKSFALHVTMKEQDKILEDNLVKLINTIEFAGSEDIMSDDKSATASVDLSE